MSESRYVYPGTDVLINLPGIRDPEELKRFEELVTKERLAQLALQPIQGSFDLEHLKSIHHFIFQDVYPFAGQIRQETIAKDFFTFAPAGYIEPAAKELFQQLKQEGHLKGLPLEQFADRAAYYMAEINVLHPFREGNGRTQREFIRQLARNAGYELDWTKVDPDRVLKASIRSKVDTKELADVIRESLSPLNQEPLLLKDLIKRVPGMPAIRNPIELTPDLLHQEVVAHSIKKHSFGHTLQVQLKGHPKRLDILMEPVQHLSQQMKNELIEQAAKGIKHLDRGRGLDLMK